MQIPCSGARVVLTTPGIRLERATPGFMVWDEHGGTFVLRVEDLEVSEGDAGGAAGGISVDIPLTDREELIRSLEEFAARQQLPLAPAPEPELLTEVVLAACHLPAQNLFVFAEGPGLAVKRRGEAVELLVSGAFKTRRVPCQTADLVIHLDKGAMARLLAVVLSLAREGR
jgi:hypothetical protein